VQIQGFVRVACSTHAPNRSNTLKFIVLRYVYYRMECVGANRSMLEHRDANKPYILIMSKKMAFFITLLTS